MQRTFLYSSKLLLNKEWPGSELTCKYLLDKITANTPNLVKKPQKFSSCQFSTAIMFIWLAIDPKLCYLLRACGFLCVQLFPTVVFVRFLIVIWNWCHHYFFYRCYCVRHLFTTGVDMLWHTSKEKFSSLWKLS